MEQPGQGLAPKSRTEPTAHAHASPPPEPPAAPPAAQHHHDHHQQQLPSTTLLSRAPSLAGRPQHGQDPRVVQGGPLPHRAKLHRPPRRASPSPSPSPRPSPRPAASRAAHRATPTQHPRRPPSRPAPPSTAGATDEDDGVLLSTVLGGDRNSSYLPRSFRTRALPLLLLLLLLLLACSLSTSPTWQVPPHPGRQDHGARRRGARHHRSPRTLPPCEHPHPCRERTHPPTRPPVARPTQADDLLAPPATQANAPIFVPYSSHGTAWPEA